VVLGQLFRLPRPEYKQQYYSTVLLELCKIADSPFVSILTMAVVLLAERVNHMVRRVLE
jgi:hypothetical protein